MGVNNWTRTTAEKIFIRLFMMIYILKFVNSHTKFGNFKTDSFAYLIFAKCIVKLFIAGLFYFCVFKYIFRGFGLTYEKNNVYSFEDGGEKLKDVDIDEESRKELIEKEKDSNVNANKINEKGYSSKDYSKKS